MSVLPARGTRTDGGPGARAVVTALVAGAGLVAFAGMRPSQPWLLFFTAALVGLAAAGTVSMHPRQAGRREVSALGFALLPGVCVLSGGAFADRVLEGYARVGGACGGAALAGFAVFAEYHAVDPNSRFFGPVRVALAVTSYAAAFAIFAVMFQDSVGLVPSVAATGLASWLLASGLLREGAVDLGALTAGFAVGLSLAELRGVLYFFPVEGVLGGAILLVGFHVAAGLVHHLLDRDLTLATIAEYGVVAGAGTAAVAIAAAAG